MSVTTRVFFGVMLGFATLCAPAVKAVTFQTLHSFTGGADGGAPYAGLTSNVKGELFGAASSGGANGLGTIFGFDPVSQTLKTLYSFTASSAARSPGTGLTIDKAGMLYGTTAASASPYEGTVFKLDPSTGTLTILYAFSGSADGGDPNGGLVIDSRGMIFGTTLLGGGNGSFMSEGTVFQLDPVTRALSTLVVFGGYNGGYPFAGLSPRTSTTYYGATNRGTIFTIAPATKALKVLYSFNGANEANPRAALVSDASGTLYGTTFEGGGKGSCLALVPNTCGTVFKFVPGTRKMTFLHSFAGGADGALPEAPLVIGPNGVLYGTTSAGGGACPAVNSQGCGTVFKYDPVKNKLTILHAFTGGADGAYLTSGLTMDSHGALYGTTSRGGANNLGTIFKITP